MRGNQKPHLVLNFDVNNTVVMLDSATGADSKGLIAMVLSNSAWGTIQLDADGQPLSWQCQWSELTTQQPMPGLQTYTEFLGHLSFTLFHSFVVSKVSIAVSGSLEGHLSCECTFVLLGSARTA